MFHIPSILIIYGIAQIIHIALSYYDHKHNVCEHNKHKEHQDQSNRKITELENVIKRLESGIEGGVEGGIENAIDHKLKKKVIDQVEKEVDKLIDKVL
jgi:hypothetical protein